MRVALDDLGGRLGGFVKDATTGMERNGIVGSGRPLDYELSHIVPHHYIKQAKSTGEVVGCYR